MDERARPPGGEAAAEGCRWAAQRAVTFLRERTGIDRGVTECLTERIFDDFEADEVNEIYRADDEADLDDATRLKLSDINGACFAEAAPETTAPEGGGEDVGGSSSTTEGDATTTSAPADTSSTTAAGGG